MVLSWALADQENGRAGLSGLGEMPVANHDAARPLQEESMFVCGNVSGRQRAGYVAWALVIGMAPALLPSGDARAQGMNMKDMSGTKKDMPAMKGEARKTAAGTGTVTAVNTANRKVTLDHGPIPDINWPAMKMEFSVAPSVDLSKVKTGDQVRFTLSGSGNSYTVQSINPGQ
jgi:Cu/Ag efflux protein CusF